jgi:hypothetical protein
MRTKVSGFIARPNTYNTQPQATHRQLRSSGIRALALEDTGQVPAGLRDRLLLRRGVEWPRPRPAPERRHVDIHPRLNQLTYQNQDLDSGFVQDSFRIQYLYQLADLAPKLLQRRAPGQGRHRRGTCPPSQEWLEYQER